MNNKRIESVELTPNGTLEVVVREFSRAMLLCHPPRPAPDQVWKDVYGAVDGKIQLVTTRCGMHRPQEIIEESFSFGDEK